MKTGRDTMFFHYRDDSLFDKIFRIATSLAAKIVLHSFDSMRIVISTVTIMQNVFLSLQFASVQKMK